MLTGLLALTGTKIGVEMFAWTAVFILPVNSALNPFLYAVPAVKHKMVSLPFHTSHLVGFWHYIYSKYSNSCCNIDIICDCWLKRVIRLHASLLTLSNTGFCGPDLLF